MENFKIPLFQLSQITATPGAIDLLEHAHIRPLGLLLRHIHGYWDTVCKEDAKANWLAVEHGGRILSAYRLGENERLWIITEVDRSATTLLLPSEY